MKNTIANVRILDVVRLVHGYSIFVFLIMDQFRTDVALWVQKLRGHYDAIFIEQVLCCNCSFRPDPGHPLHSVTTATHFHLETA
jgi:hypothetical protein